MSALRFISIVLLACWVGGLAALGVVAAPVIFAVITQHDPVAGPVLAGTVFGAVFAKFQHFAWVLGAILAAVLATRAAIGPRPRWLGLRLWTVAAMLAMSLVSTLVLTPRIDRLRTGSDTPMALVANDDPRKIEFDRLHGLSSGMMLITILAGLGLLWAEAIDRP